MPSPSRSTSGRLAVPASVLIIISAFVHACGGGGSSGGGSPPAPSPGPGTTTFTVTSRFPANSATDVPRQPIVLVGFNDIVQAGTVSNGTVTLSQGAVLVASTVTYLACNNRVQLIPNAPLDPALEYTVNLTAGLLDDDGEALTPSAFSFTTTASPDVVRPTFTEAGFMGEPNMGSEINEVRLDWDNGMDDLSTPTEIFYRVYFSTQPACFDFSDPDFETAPGVTEAVVPGLAARTDYSFVVRAVDAGGNESTNVAPITVTTFTSFIVNVYPVVSTFCVACHNPPNGQAWTFTPSITMDYSTANTVYTSWINVASSWGVGPRVTPGDPNASFLWDKINSAGPAAGDPMPLGLPPLSADNQDIIFDWIMEGALDN